MFFDFFRLRALKQELARYAEVSLSGYWAMSFDYEGGVILLDRKRVFDDPRDYEAYINGILKKMMTYYKARFYDPNKKYFVELTGNESGISNGYAHMKIFEKQIADFCTVESMYVLTKYFFLGDSEYPGSKDRLGVSSVSEKYREVFHNIYDIKPADKERYDEIITEAFEKTYEDIGSRSYPAYVKKITEDLLALYSDIEFSDGDLVFRKEVTVDYLATIKKITDSVSHNATGIRMSREEIEDYCRAVLHFIAKRMKLKEK